MFSHWLSYSTICASNCRSTPRGTRSPTTPVWGSLKWSNRFKECSSASWAIFSLGLIEIETSCWETYEKSKARLKWVSSSASWLNIDLCILSAGAWKAKLLSPHFLEQHQYACVCGLTLSYLIPWYSYTHSAQICTIFVSETLLAPSHRHTRLLTLNCTRRLGPTLLMHSSEPSSMWHL